MLEHLVALTSRAAFLQLQDAESERRRRIARLQAVVMTLENLLIHPAGEPPEAEGPASNRRSSDAEGGIAAATTSERVAAIKAAPSSKRRRRLVPETLAAT